MYLFPFFSFIVLLNALFFSEREQKWDCVESDMLYIREDKAGNQTLSLNQKWFQNYALYKHFDSLQIYS